MFELKQYPQQQPQLLQLHDVQFVIIENEAQFVTQNLLNADGVLIQAATHYEAESILHKIRSHKTKEVSLMPVYVDAGLSYAKRVAHLFDGIFDPNKQAHILQSTKQIALQLRRIQSSIHELDFDRFSKLRFLQYMFSREAFLKPVLNRSAQFGYAYPFVYSFNSKKDDLYTFDLLNQLSEDGYLKSRVHDKTHSCSSCHGGILNYRECCPKCSSTDLDTSDLIHHFVCANIGPEDDYKSNGELICPKCDKNLRHIGIDYDKPSSMHNCNACNHEFQNANVKAMCIDCGSDNDLSQLGDHTIYTYEITQKGEYASQNGFNDSSNKRESSPSSISAIVSPEIFELFKKQEMHRVRIDHTASFEINVSISSTTLEQLHEERQELIQKEIVQIIANYLQATDLVSSKHVRKYNTLICSSSLEHVETLSELFYNNIIRLLSDGVQGTDISIDIELFDLREEVD